MDRMLGNQLFLARKFEEAIPHLERANSKYPGDLPTTEKLILCYIFASQLEHAKAHFLKILNQPFSGTFDKYARQNHSREKELFAEWTTNLPNLLSEKERVFALGIIATFFDTKLAGCYFRKAQQLDPQDGYLQEILELLAKKQHICFY